MLIDNKFNLKDVVYLQTDKAQDERIITRMQVTLNGLLYELTCGSVSSWHYEFEITTEKNVLKQTDN